MSTSPKVHGHSTPWSQEAFAMAAQAKVLSGNKLEQLVVRLQRHSGRAKQTCWQFIIQYGLKGKVDHRRWSDEEIETLREELVKHSIEEVAKKIHRTPLAIRSILKRNQLRVRDIRCDLFSLESLAAALHVRKSELRFWIDQGWLPATISMRGGRQSYTITPEGLMHLYKHHHQEVIRRGIPNQSLFDAYVQYCFSPKHTVGEQLLDVRRDKRERAAVAMLARDDAQEQDDEEDEDAEDEGRYSVRF